MSELPAADLAALRELDTPTVCNALEVVAPERRGYGFTTAPFVCRWPQREPIVGYARTATIRAAEPSGRDPAADIEARLGYYAYVAGGPGPTITVIEDLDPAPGVGSFWGEVNSNLHKGLGSLGVVTNGSIRDLDDVAEGFQLLAGLVGPSHAFVHVEAFGQPVTVHGMRVESGDLIHADQHGAVVVPVAVAAAVPAAAREIAAAERVLIDASRQEGFDIDTLRRLMGADPGH